MLWLSCASGNVTPAPRAESDAAPPPVPVPARGGSGCVESRALKGFVLALESQRQRARAAAILELGVTERAAASEFAALEPSPDVGQMYTREGKRFAVVARLASVVPPVLPFGVQGNQLRALEERPQAHAVPIFVCGENSCPGAPPATLPAVRALGVELGPGEVLGAPLRFSYDYWWAQVSYDRRRACPPEPAETGPTRATAQ